MPEVKKEVKKKEEAKKEPRTTILWEKPNGTRIETNVEQANIEIAVELKWKEVK